MKFEKYYSPDKTEFRGYIIEHNGLYLSTDWLWTTAKSHACRITPEMLGGQMDAEVIVNFANIQETKEYKEALDKYLDEGIDYSTNSIISAEVGDLQQLASDSYHKGVLFGLQYKASKISE